MESANDALARLYIADKVRAIKIIRLIYPNYTTQDAINFLDKLKNSEV